MYILLQNIKYKLTLFSGGLDALAIVEHPVHYPNNSRQLHWSDPGIHRQQRSLLAWYIPPFQDGYSRSSSGWWFPRDRGFLLDVVLVGLGCHTTAWLFHGLLTYHMQTEIFHRVWYSEGLRSKWINVCQNVRARESNKFSISSFQGEWRRNARKLYKKSESLLRELDHEEPNVVRLRLNFLYWNHRWCWELPARAPYERAPTCTMSTSLYIRSHSPSSCKLNLQSKYAE